MDQVEEEPPVTLVTLRRQIDSQERITPLRTDRKHIVDTSSFRNAAYQRRIVTVFAPAGVTYDEIIKARDYRYLRETSYRGDKFVYSPPAMHRNACTCSECKQCSSDRFSVHLFNLQVFGPTLGPKSGRIEIKYTKK